MAGIIDEMTAAQACSLRLALREAVIHEIMTVRKVIDAYDTGTTDKSAYHLQVPYVEEAVNLLTNPQGNLELKVCSSAQIGTDKMKISFNQQQHDEGLLAQLVLYFLQTRGRLTKAEIKQNVFNIDFNLYISGPETGRHQKELYLENPDLLQARRVCCLGCSKDPEWSLRILQVLAPCIEDIGLSHVGLEHLCVLGTMARLRRLRISLGHEAISCDDLGPFRWRDAGESLVNDPTDPTVAWHLHELPESNAGLVWLKIDAPRQMMLPLIAQHRRTLRELVLHVGLPTEESRLKYSWQRRWSLHCNDLPEALQMLVQRYPMEALRLVELWRITSNHHGRVCSRKCVKQLRAMREVFGPKVEVRCCSCG